MKLKGFSAALLFGMAVFPILSYGQNTSTSNIQQAATGTIVFARSVTVGSTVSEMLNALGEPKGSAKANGSIFYIYDGGNIVVKNGKVISVPVDFEAATYQKKQDEKQRLEYEAKQKAKGLIEYQGQWVTPKEKEQIKEAESEALPKLQLIRWGWREHYGFAISEGVVKNISNKSLKSVSAMVMFYTPSGDVITSDEALIELDPILPGQSSPFKITTTYNPSMSKAYIQFKELFGGTINTKWD